MATGTRVERVEVDAYRIPTDAPESDGTIAWTDTTIVVVHATAGGRTGVGYTYAHHAAARVIADKLAPVVAGRDPMDVRAAWCEMVAAVRNLGRPGVAAHAISAVDVALWDLKARLLGVPLVVLFDAVTDGVAVYGSGGFTSYSDERLCEQLAGWVEQGIDRVKMKVGREPKRDPARVDAARKAIGDDATLMVDANGAFDRKQALEMAEIFAGFGVSWFEEPVTSDDLEGLRLLRDRAPAGMDIAAGEYGYDPWELRRLVDGQCVDVLQADVTRCLGMTGFLTIGGMCDAAHVPLSGHTAPQLHAHVACALRAVRHVEYFHDHVRIERMVFDGVLEPLEGRLVPDRSRPGLGLSMRRDESRKHAIEW